MSKYSQLQLEVLSLYKRCLRASSNKPSINEIVKQEFRINATIPKSEILRIEHLLRQGSRKLKMINDPFVTSIGKFTKN